MALTVGVATGLLVPYLTALPALKLREGRAIAVCRALHRQAPSATGLAMSWRSLLSTSMWRLAAAKVGCRLKALLQRLDCLLPSEAILTRLAQY